MKILLDGYFDHNLGDDLMLTLAAEGLKEHELYIPSKKINIDNVEYTEAKSGFDAYLKVIGSGFQIYNTLGIAYRLCEMHRESRYAPIKAVIGSNISPFKNKACEAVIKTHLSLFDFITVRDRFSHDYLERNLRNSKSHVYPDMVFSLPDNMIPEVKCENMLGVAVRNGISPIITARAVDGYIEETGNNVLILCFDTGIENDALAAEEVIKNSKYKNKLEIVLYENIPDMLAEMKRCSVILGARFHSIVLAARMGIPFTPLSRTSKMSQMLTDIGYVSGEPFNLPENISHLAAQHIETFKEYLKGLSR